MERCLGGMYSHVVAVEVLKSERQIGEPLLSCSRRVEINQGLERPSGHHSA